VEIEVVYLAPNAAVAGMVAELLENEEIPVILRPADIPHKGPTGPVEILTAKDKAKEARKIVESYIDSF
jgi:hypothetical protein